MDPKTVGGYCGCSLSFSYSFAQLWAFLCSLSALFWAAFSTWFTCIGVDEGEVDDGGDEVTAGGYAAGAAVGYG